MALKNAKEALGLHIWGMECDGEDLPAPTLTLPAWLNAAAQEHNINFSQVLQDALKQQLHVGV